MKKIAIIVAGGNGTRMGSAIPKQFLPLAGLPMLYWSIQAFHAYDSTLEQIIVLPKPQLDYWKELVKHHQIAIPHRIVSGGAERFFSVKNALEGLAETEDAWVAVHDAARPFISKEYIDSLFRHAETFGSALPTLPLKDSIRRRQGEAWVPADRNAFKIIQTPQIFSLLYLKKAYTQDYHTGFTDDAGVVESAGYSVSLAEGSEDAFKVTTAHDLELARILAENKRIKAK